MYETGQSVNFPSTVGETMFATFDRRRYRNWLAYMGLYYAMLNDVQKSERFRYLVRRIDRGQRFRLQSLN